MNSEIETFDGHNNLHTALTMDDKTCNNDHITDQDNNVFNSDRESFSVMETMTSTSQGPTSGCCCNRTGHPRRTMSCLSLCLILFLLSVLVCVALMFTSATAGLLPNLSTTSDPVMLTEGRCFSMCEPDDLSHRDDKLMKPIVVHNGISPTRFFLYLFPEEPKFKVEEVGEPGFLSPLIKSGRIQEAREKARVHLDQWPTLESYAGFLNVNQKYNSHLYFWFFPSQSDPGKDPVILWLQGGPGATSLFGLFKENGPIKAYAVSDNLYSPTNFK